MVRVRINFIRALPQGNREKPCGFIGITSSNIDWDHFDEHYQTEIFHQFNKVTNFDRIAGRLSNCDVDMGTNDDEEDMVHGPRVSVDSWDYDHTPHQSKKGAAKVKRESDDLTSSAERFITELVEELYRVGLELSSENEAIGNSRETPTAADTTMSQANGHADRRTVEAAAEILEQIMAMPDRDTMTAAQGIVQDIIRQVNGVRSSKP